MRTVSIVGARPQFIKLAPVSRAMHKAGDFDDIILHTGQHYDPGMSDVFFTELNIPEATENMGIGSGAHGEQTARMLESIESALLRHEPDMVVIYGDTNSTLAGALAAAKQHIPVAHIEAGLRSFDRHMPEEVNRIVADHTSDLLLAPTETAMQNLQTEGLTGRSRLVGDVMLDAVLYNRELATANSDIVERLKLTGKQYAVATLHRASNTDTDCLREALDAFNQVSSKQLPIVFAIHPRTAARIKADLPHWQPDAQLHIIEPVGYLDMLALIDSSALVLTDSGGLQKEVCFLGKPCITLREQTEWPETVSSGSNVLVGTGSAKIIEAVAQRLTGDYSGSTAQSLFGNGKASEAIVAELAAF